MTSLLNFPMRFLLALSLFVPLSAAAQNRSNATPQSLNVGVRFSAIEANAPPSTCGCFWLTGAAADAALPVLSHFSAVIEVAGATVGHVAGTSRGLSEITLLAGPRYTVPLPRIAVNAQALFGAVRGFDADFNVGPTHTDTSTNFGMALGGSLELPLTRRITVRVAQVDYQQTNLPNGAGNRQKNLRLGTGLTFRIPLPRSR